MSAVDVPVPTGLAGGGRAAAWAPQRAVAAFLDVDGTTTDVEPRASPGVVAAFARASAAGVRLGFATGRPPQGLARLRAQLGAPVESPGSVDVVHNGALVVQGGAVLASWPLPRAAAHQLARWCLAEGLYAELYSGPRMFVTDRRQEVRIGWDDVSGPPDGDAADLLARAADGSSGGDVEKMDVEKMTVDVFEVERLAEVVAAAEGLGLTVEHSTAPFLPGVPVLNVTAPGVTKGSALRWWAERSQTPLERLLVVGDGLNDLSMLGLAGTAVAMGQAGERVRAAAHLVTASVEHDGAAVVLDLLARGAL